MKFIYFGLKRKNEAIFTFLGGVARVFAGVHYPFDIIGSMFTASIGVLIVMSLKTNLQNVNEIILKIDRKIFGA